MIFGEELCPLGDFHIHEAVADFDVAACIGLGLCVSTCLTDEINLVKRDDYVTPPANLNELVKKVSEKKRTKT